MNPASFAALRIQLTLLEKTYDDRTIGIVTTTLLGILSSCFDPISTKEFDKDDHFKTTEASAFFDSSLDLLIFATQIRHLDPTSALFKTFSDRLAAVMKLYFDRSKLSNEARAKRAVVLEGIKIKIARIHLLYAIDTLRAAVAEAEEALKLDTPLKPTLTSTMTSAAAVATKTTAAALFAAAAKSTHWLAVAGAAAAQFAAVPPSGAEASATIAVAPTAAAAGGAGVSAATRAEATTEESLKLKVRKAIENYQRTPSTAAGLITLIGSVISELSRSFDMGIWRGTYLSFSPEEIKTHIEPFIKSALLYNELLQSYLSPAQILSLWEKPFQLINTYLLINPHRLDETDPGGGKRRALIAAIKDQLSGSRESFLKEQYDALTAKISELCRQFDSIYPPKSWTEYTAGTTAVVVAGAAAAAAAAATTVGTHFSQLQATTIAAAAGTAPLKVVGDATATMIAQARAAATAAGLASTAAAAAATVAVAGLTRTSLPATSNTAAAAVVPPETTGLTVVIPTESPSSPPRTPVDSLASIPPLPLDFCADIAAALAAATNTPAAGIATAPSSARAHNTELMREVERLGHTLVTERDYRGISGIFHYLGNFGDRKKAKIELLGLWLQKSRGDSTLSPYDALVLAKRAMKNPQRVKLAEAGLFSNRVAALVSRATPPPTRTPGISAS